MSAGDRVWIAYALLNGHPAAVYGATVTFADGGAVYARCSSGVLHAAGSDSCKAFAAEADAWAWCGERYRQGAAEMLAEAARCDAAAVADSQEAA